jgi:hypothetical protein
MMYFGILRVPVYSTRGHDLSVQCPLGADQINILPFVFHMAYQRVVHEVWQTILRLGKSQFKLARI